MLEVPVFTCGRPPSDFFGCRAAPIQPIRRPFRRSPPRRENWQQDKQPLEVVTSPRGASQRQFAIKICRQRPPSFPSFTRSFLSGPRLLAFLYSPPVASTA